MLLVILCIFDYTWFYDIAFVNSEPRWAMSRVNIAQCEHEIFLYEFLKLVSSLTFVVDPDCWRSLVFQVGLAVDDIKAVQAQANLKRQAMLVRTS